MTPLDQPRALLRTLAAAGMLALLAVPAGAAESPAAPYYSVHLDTAGSKARALQTLQALAAEPAARAEKRRSGWLVRVGAWPAKADADAALERLGAGRKEARVIQVENPVEWLLASGETLPPLAAGGRAAAAVGAPAAPVARATAPDDAQFKAGATELDHKVREWLAKTPARADGYVYGMDVAPLLLYAAERGDRDLYLALLPHARALIVRDPNPATAGYVLWRHKDGADPEITGSEEAAWTARALWSGARTFDRAEDRTLAAKVVAGYARHAAEQFGVWSVRKYYSFASRSFASLSVLTAYHADFFSETENAAPGAKGLGQRSYATIQRAVTPSKLLAPLVQADLGEHFAGMGAQRFAPDDVAMLGDACLGAEGAQRGLPHIARAVLAFAAEPSRLGTDGRLFAYYERRSGKPVGTAVLGSSGYACLARLAVNLGDRKAARGFQHALLGDMRAVASPGAVDPLYSAGPLLRAAHALRAFR